MGERMNVQANERTEREGFLERSLRSVCHEMIGAWNAERVQPDRGSETKAEAKHRVGVLVFNERRVSHTLDSALPHCARRRVQRSSHRCSS